MLSKIRSIVAIFALGLSSVTAQQVRKILALHGGGGTPSGFRGELRDLERALPEFEFVYARGGFPVDGGNNNLWIPDPPSKDRPTTSPNIADASLNNLNQILEEEGPFYGILGYSQGAAFVPVYLANAPVGSFEKAMMFCGYLTETHLGLLDQVETESPFGDISSLIWIGEQDTVIPPSMSRDLVPKFTSPTVVSSRFGGHIVPGPSDSTFDQVLAFVRGEDLPTNNDPDISDNDDPADDVQVSDEDKSDDVQVSDEDKSEDTVEDCVDDPSFRFRNKKNRNCQTWVAANPKVRCIKRWRGKTVSENCPASCGVCKPEGKPEEKPEDKPDNKPEDNSEDKPDNKPEDKPEEKPEEKECVDDPNFRFRNKKNRDCQTWVAANPKVRCSKKWKGKTVSGYCPGTCYACKK